MNKPTILVLGATGKTGREATLELLRHSYPVRAMVHREDQRAQALREAGAETVVGDLVSIDDVSRAMEGVHRAYFVCPFTPNQLDVSMNFAVAAADNKLEHVVAMSQWLSSPLHHSMATRRTYLTDRLMAWLPDSTMTLINVGFFADNYMALLEPIAHLGMFPMPLGEGFNAPVSNGDIGRCVAAALMEPEKHAGKTYRPCGPELLSPHQIAEVFGKVLGRRVKYQHISDRMFLKAGTSMGFPAELMSQLLLYFAEYRHGAFAAGAPNGAVQHLTGREPEDFETIVRDYVEGRSGATGLMPVNGRVPALQQTLGNRARAAMNFARLLLTPAPDLERLATERGFPQVQQTLNVLDDRPWASTHSPVGSYGA